MALLTANEIIAEIKAEYPGVDTTTVSNHLAYVMRDICTSIPVALKRVSLALTADTAEYELKSGSPWYGFGSASTSSIADSVGIETAVYVESADSRTPLETTSQDYLFQNYPDYGYEESGTPRYVFLSQDSSGNQTLVLYPAPDTTSDPADGTGYPRLDVTFRLDISSSFTGTQALPDTIKDPSAILRGVVARIKRRENGSADPELEDAYTKEKGKLFQRLVTASRRNTVKINMPTYRRKI